MKFIAKAVPDTAGMKEAAQNRCQLHIFQPQNFGPAACGVLPAKIGDMAAADCFDVSNLEPLATMFISDVRNTPRLLPCRLKAMAVQG